MRGEKFKRDEKLKKVTSFGEGVSIVATKLLGRNKMKIVAPRTIIPIGGHPRAPNNNPSTRGKQMKTHEYIFLK